MPVIVVRNELLEKLKSNIEEVRARGGVVVFADARFCQQRQHAHHRDAACGRGDCKSSTPFRCSCWPITLR
jgi:glucosamine 6-phosphate synthetase-like amidotransferase/phosphosugar isomerase protein